MSDVASTRLGEREKRMVERAARRVGMSRSEFLRRAAVDRADEVLTLRELSRGELVERIVSHERCPWARRELQSKSLDDLRKIDRLIRRLPLGR